MKKVILIVEDDPKNSKLFRDVLQVAGYTTFEAVNGQQGVDMAREQRPDLVLMDIQMPVMDGCESVRILKEDPDTSDIRVVALTASAMDGSKERILQSGFDGYISKPISIKPFLQKVAELLNG